jgi:formamidase
MTAPLATPTRVAGPGHNRWHPSVPAAVTVGPGDVVELQATDGLAGQVDATTPASALADFDTGVCHPLAGPIAIRGVQPGDRIDVEILAIAPSSYGTTVVVPGEGLLGDLVDEPLIVHWTIADGEARSAQLPGVVIPGAPFLGVVGVAPSAASVARFAARERLAGDVHPPSAAGAAPAGAAEGLRTIAPRETGGNLDMKRAVVGSVISLRADVAGGLVSVGDPHFAQGDGECCGTAIEVSAQVTLRLSVVPAGDADWAPRFPVVWTPDTLYTTGLSSGVDGDGADRALTTAVKAAVRDMHGYLTSVRGLTAEQAYALISVAVDLQVSEVVNAPNALVSAALPLNIFEA